MRPLTSLLTLVLGVSLSVALSACGDDPVNPGGMNVNWSQGAIATCESRHLVTVEARAYLKDELIDRQQGPCASAERKGTIALTELPPGNYRVEAEGLDAAGKGTYLGTMDKVPVREDTIGELNLTLNQKPARIQVIWNPPGNGRCAGNAVRTVTVSLIYDATTTETTQASEDAGCDAEFTDDTGESDAGMLFEGLTPNNDVVIVVVGQDASGNDLARVVSDPFVLGAGDNLTGTAAIELNMENCPGQPPVCP